MSQLKVICLVLLFAAPCGCASRSASELAGQRYFDSPQDAVATTAQLLLEESWETLATYYDLSGTDIDRADLHSGRFFIRTERPEGAHPAGFWRYREPFAPAFGYVHEEMTDEPDVVKVVVMVEIEQGDGRVQRGLDQFLLRRSSHGYQLLPK
jgi:hypothetical protein